jgi:periplasmic divalent cation tolerance protein
MEQATGEILILTTLATREDAEGFAHTIVSARLAACATCLDGALSFYRWQSEEILREPEVLVLLKTHRTKLLEIEDFFKQHHPYEVPEFLVFDLTEVSASYQKWMKEELRLI